MAMNAKVHSVARVENANFGLPGTRLTFMRLSLPKIGDRFG